MCVCASARVVMTCGEAERSGPGLYLGSTKRFTSAASHGRQIEGKFIAPHFNVWLNVYGDRRPSQERRKGVKARR